VIRVRLRVPSPTLNAGLRALLASDPELAILSDGVTMDDADHYHAEAHVVIATPAALAADAISLLAETPEAGIIVLGDNTSDIRLLTSTTHPWGLLSLDATADELSAAVRAVAAGLVVGARTLLAASQGLAPARGPLTEREVEILGLLSKGLPNKQIALQLSISEHTVKFHVSSIYTKLDASNRTEAVRAGLLNGWIAL
jgi:DNA-binding NarL/FixJ family response regulator